MKVMPIRYSADVEASVRFYAALGLEAGVSDTPPRGPQAHRAVSRPRVWVEMPATAGVLAIHHAPADEAGVCELAFESEEPLEAVVTRLRAAGFDPDAIADENFGRSLRIKDPDGVWVQVNEHDHELYS
jgi:hypothetical protein